MSRRRAKRQFDPRLGYLPAAFCLALSVAGGLTAAREFVPVFTSDAAVADAFASLSSEVPQSAASDHSRDLVLDSCRVTMGSLYARVQPERDWRQLLANCQRAAAEMTETTPAYSYGWLVRAMADAELGDAASFNRSIEMSQATAPNISWLALNRALLVEAHYEMLSAELQSAHDADLRRSVASHASLPAIARLYASDPDFRPRISGLVEAMSEADQARFLDAVKYVVARRGNLAS